MVDKKLNHDIHFASVHYPLESISYKNWAIITFSIDVHFFIRRLWIVIRRLISPG